MLPYVKQITSPGSMHETGFSGPVYWDDPEGWDGKEVGGGFRMGSTLSLPDVPVTLRTHPVWTLGAHRDDTGEFWGSSLCQEDLKTQLQRAEKTHKNQAPISTPQRVTSTLFITDRASEQEADVAVPPGKVLE